MFFLHGRRRRSGGERAIGGRVAASSRPSALTAFLPFFLSFILSFRFVVVRFASLHSVSLSFVWLVRWVSCVRFTTTNERSAAALHCSERRRPPSTVHRPPSVHPPSTVHPPSDQPTNKRMNQRTNNNNNNNANARRVTSAPARTQTAPRIRTATWARKEGRKNMDAGALQSRPRLAYTCLWVMYAANEPSECANTEGGSGRGGQAPLAWSTMRA